MKIAILDDYQNVALQCADWGSLGAEIEVFDEPFAGPDETVTRLAGFDVVVAMRERTPFPAAVFDRLPELKLLVSTGRRNAAIDLDAAKRCGVVVSATGALAAPTVEHAWALILAGARNLPLEFRSMREGGWQVGLGMALRDKTLGLLGLGRLGAEVARIGQAFGMKPIAWSQNLTPERAAEHGVTAVSKEDLFARSDVLSVHLVLSERTRGLVGAAELAAMKPAALLVNTSRGPIVDESALVDALRGKKIAAAALDVYDVEPLPADHPLRTLDNAILTPHIGYVSRETYEIFYGGAVEDIAAFRAGEPINVLN
ncbi:MULTISPECIES: D-2-hydroxyacid dehydrogenase family protein [Amycolatopsis]|uniref:D-2-hydroxyacid dehydrogenase family protein n=1 Tax=Amycolatopsis dendrobii TaxID=2760662 RepID=A0A7W3ZA18_9PSEU|nr:MULTISPECIES: D-2-hydroxyacid dehydrogenase family protein [Amycolatopsis]MBB1153314.1 D-2-hydroxyacid dehydrogenase family protein [Amycolatopsis dendrobii]UKD55833.1 D-2-hydroxyacid dehydrogenase family protein [Amycolatopsis sp. FU40]